MFEFLDIDLGLLGNHHSMNHRRTPSLIIDLDYQLALWLVEHPGYISTWHDSRGLNVSGKSVLPSSRCMGDLGGVSSVHLQG